MSSNKNKQILIKIWKDTKRKIEQLNVQTSPSEVIYQISHGKTIKKYTQTNFYDCEVTVTNIDTLVKAREFVGRGLNPMIINMASVFKPGGGVENGALAQEEELFRRTTLSSTLTKDLGYPLVDCIYSPKIWIIKDEKYQDIDPIPISCLSTAAVKNPSITIINKQWKFMKIPEAEIMRQKIEMMFRVGIIKGHDSLILGAFGCGAYCNPSEPVAELFVDALHNYSKYFKAIDFAIYSNLKRDHNYEVFNFIIDYHIINRQEEKTIEDLDNDCKDEYLDSSLLPEFDE